MKRQFSYPLKKNKSLFVKEVLVLYDLYNSENASGNGVFYDKLFKGQTQMKIQWMLAPSDGTSPEVQITFHNILNDKVHILFDILIGIPDKSMFKLYCDG